MRLGCARLVKATAGIGPVVLAAVGIVILRTALLPADAPNAARSESERTASAVLAETSPAVKVEGARVEVPAAERTAAPVGPTVRKSAPRVLESSDLRIRPEDVRRHIRFLADPARRGRSGRGAREAARYIRDRFAAWGLKPLFDGSFFQPIPGVADANGKLPTVGENVGAWIPGRDPELKHEFILIGAHYDHLGVRGGKVYPGADDNASGVAMMLELARHRMQAADPPRRSLAFVGFDLEEHMLWGSRWFAAHPPWPIDSVKLFITADMIGRSLGDLPLPTVFMMGSEHAPELDAVLERIAVPRGLEVARLGVDLIGTRSDYGPFRDRRVPFLFFSTGEHPDYHTPADTADRIDYAKVARISELILRLTEEVANAQTVPQWVEQPDPSLEEVRTLLRVCDLLLDGNEAQLSGVQRLVVSQARAQARAVMRRGRITRAERASLVRMAQLMLLSVF